MNQTETIQIFLNSKTANKYYNGFTSHCQFNLPHFIIPRSKSVYISIQPASIPYSFYNVDRFNDTLVYSVNGGSNIKIQIPKGNNIKKLFIICYEWIYNHLFFIG